MENCKHQSLYSKDICWVAYIKSLCTLEFHISISCTQVLENIVQYFLTLCRSEESVLGQFIKLHVHASVRHLHIARILPTLQQLPSQMETLPETLMVENNFSTYIINTLFSVISELLSSCDKSSDTDLSAWHEILLQSVRCL